MWYIFYIQEQKIGVISYWQNWTHSHISQYTGPYHSVCGHRSLWEMDIFCCLSTLTELKQWNSRTWIQFSLASGTTGSHYHWHSCISSPTLLRQRPLVHMCPVTWYRPRTGHLDPPIVSQKSLLQLLCWPLREKKEKKFMKKVWFELNCVHLRTQIVGYGRISDLLWLMITSLKHKIMAERFVKIMTWNFSI